MSKSTEKKFTVTPLKGTNLLERIRTSAIKNDVAPNRYVVEAILSRLKKDERRNG